MKNKGVLYCALNYALPRWPQVPSVPPSLPQPARAHAGELLLETGTASNADGKQPPMEDVQKLTADNFTKDTGIKVNYTTWGDYP